MAQDIQRKLVVDGLLKVENSGFSNIVLTSLIDDNRLSPQDKSFVTTVFYGTIERKLTLNFILQQFISKPLSKLDKEVIAIMQSGLYQILYMNSVPDFAAINQAVSLCSTFKKTSAKGLVNAVLRKAAKFDINTAKFKNETQRLSVLYSVSEEIVNLIRRDWPAECETILQSSFKQPGVVININTTKVSTDEYKQILSENGVEYAETPLQNCIEILSKGAVTSLPYFDEGYFFVQGITSRYAARCTGAKVGSHVVDLCAAPGGKSFATGILMENTGSIISCDPNPSRHVLIEKGAQRLGLTNITTLENSGEVYNPALCGRQAIICDVPCSGIGIIPKKPDLRYKKMEDLEQLVQLQHDILATRAKYIEKNGRIVYSTCTINRDENQRQIEKFLSENPDFRLAPQSCPVKTAINYDNMVTFLPTTPLCDGFFVAVLEKVW